jgi:AAHS family 4-hydroxybenzoate transporter-like MFS transporter
VIAAIAIALIGQPGFALPALVGIVTIAGACVVGAQPALNTLAATYYPTYLRSTGLGWALGIGRAGSIVGPIVTGAFQAWMWTPQQIFLALAVPAAISALGIVALRAALDGRAAAT